MKIKTIITILLLINWSINYSQCETYKTPLSDNLNITSMSEKIHQNIDLENGAKTFYISFNSIHSELNKEESVNSLVLTYVSTKSDYWITPNLLTIGFPSGEVLKLKASSKSSQTYNLYNPVPNTSKSIECFYILEYDKVLKLIGEEKISYLYVSDYRNDKIVNITPEYNGLLKEMLECVLEL